LPLKFLACAVIWEANMVLDLVLECAVFANDCTVFARDCAVLARAEFPLRRFSGIAPCFLHCAILVDLRLIFW